MMRGVAPKTSVNPRPLGRGWITLLQKVLNISLSKLLLMIVADGASVTETPRLKRGSMWYASAPSNSPISGYNGSHLCGVGATLSACGAPPSTRGERLRARWGYEAGSLALQGGAAHDEEG